MATKLNVGPTLGGVGISAVALSATFTVGSTGIIFDQVVEAAQSSCSLRKAWLLAATWTDIVVPTGLGQAPAGVLIVPPSTNYAIEIRRRAHYAGGDTTTIYDRLHKNAPFLWFFDQASVPVNIDLYWAGQNWSARAVAVSAAAPAVFTDVGHSLVNGECIYLTGATTVPGGLSLGVPYYVVNTAATFNIAATPGGAALAATSTGSGVTYSTDNGFLLAWL